VKSEAFLKKCVGVEVGRAIPAAGKSF